MCGYDLLCCCYNAQLYYPDTTQPWIAYMSGHREGYFYLLSMQCSQFDKNRFMSCGIDI
jgi:hypothetical protein